MERPIEVELEDCQIEWVKHHPGDRILEIDPDSQADKVVVTSMENCIDLIDSNFRNDHVHPDEIEEYKRLREACLLVIEHFGTKEESR